MSNNDCSAKHLVYQPMRRLPDVLKWHQFVPDLLTDCHCLHPMRITANYIIVDKKLLRFGVLAAAAFKCLYWKQHFYFYYYYYILNRNRIFFVKSKQFSCKQYNGKKHFFEISNSFSRNAIIYYYLLYFIIFLFTIFTTNNIQNFYLTN